MFKVVERRRAALIERYFGKLFIEGQRAGMVRKDVPAKLIIEILLAIVQSIMNPAKMEELGMMPKEGFAGILKIVLEGALTAKGTEKHESSFIAKITPAKIGRKLVAVARRELWRYFSCSPVATVGRTPFRGPLKWTKRTSVREWLVAWRKFSPRKAIVCTKGKSSRNSRHRNCEPAAILAAAQIDTAIRDADAQSAQLEFLRANAKRAKGFAEAQSRFTQRRRARRQCGQDAGEECRSRANADYSGARSTGRYRSAAERDAGSRAGGIHSRSAQRESRRRACRRIAKSRRCFCRNIFGCAFTFQKPGSA